MISGLFAGITWALETVLLGIALSSLGEGELAPLAPFLATFIHDTVSAILSFIYNLVTGQGKELIRLFKPGTLKWLALSSAIGGPVGMTGYVLAVDQLGASVGAVACAVYPAVGTALACIFLKEKVSLRRWCFLLLTVLGVYGLSYSPSTCGGSVWLGLLGAFMCAVGWGAEAVILAKCLGESGVKSQHALVLRQSVSAIIYGLLILPVLGGWRVLPSLFTGDPLALIPIALAAMFATLSYLLYYRAIARVGAAKAMALNITYTGWAILFSFLILPDHPIPAPFMALCAVLVVVFGVLSSADLSELFPKRSGSK